MEQFKNKFIEEAIDLIQDLEKSSLELSADPLNSQHIEVIFRAMHSLKGGSSMFGFDKIDAFTHQLETAYDKVRSGKMKVTGELLDLTFKAIDHIKVLLAEDDQLNEGTLRTHQFLLSKIGSIIDGEKSELTNALANEGSDTPAMFCFEKLLYSVYSKSGYFSQWNQSCSNCK
jgi:two-component system, chemotaxis family, sensor kinase CheA